MAKITRERGVSNADLPDVELELEDAGELDVSDALEAAAEPASDPGPSGDDEPDTSAESDTEPGETGDPGDVDPEPTEVIDLPPVNALRSVWEAALVDAGVSAEWAANVQSKDELIRAGRAIADGTYVIVDGTPVER